MPDIDRIVGAMILLVVVGALFIPLVDTVNSETGTQAVTNESVTAEVGTYVDLENNDLVSSSVTVYNSTDAEMTEGTDYEVAYDNGSVKALSGGSITDGNTITVSYDYEATSDMVATIAGLIPLLILVSVLAFVAAAVRDEVA